MPNSKIRKLVYKMIQDLDKKLEKGIISQEQHKILEKALFETIPDLDKAEEPK